MEPYNYKKEVLNKAAKPITAECNYYKVRWKTLMDQKKKAQLKVSTNPKYLKMSSIQNALPLFFISALNFAIEASETA